ncbi:hypothetical protein PO124_13020 [Bacillus licheniformis]|nr:hypothetical protein [Bacillus licheniformis]
MHFQAAIERFSYGKTSIKSDHRLSYGHRNVTAAADKIERKFHQIAVMDCIAKADLADYTARYKDIELVISTVSLEDLSIPHIVVSPLLESADEKSSATLWISSVNRPAKTKTFKVLNDTTPFSFLAARVRTPLQAD